MIAFFPELYEDELAYSWFSRYYTKSGYLSLRYALDDLYVKRYVNPDTEFGNELRPEVLPQNVTLPEEEDFPERTERYIKNKIKEYYTWCTRRLAESLEEAARRLRGR